MPRPVIFLDDGGVISDNRLRSAQWQHLVAEFLVPRLGGTPEAWAAANGQMIRRMLQPGSWEARMRAAPDYVSFERQYHIDWLRWMCESVGVEAPADEECVALGHATTRYAIPRVQAAFPGAVAAIRELHQQGYVLHTASGEPSEDLEGYLQGMGVRAYFGRLYGPDLVDTFKDGPLFYQHIFADAGVEPQDALVVDDNANAIGWAAQVGAKTALIGEAPPPGARSTLCISSLSELPASMERLR